MALNLHYTTVLLNCYHINEEFIVRMRAVEFIFFMNMYLFVCMFVVLTGTAVFFKCLSVWIFWGAVYFQGC